MDKKFIRNLFLGLATVSILMLSAYKVGQNSVKAEIKEEGKLDLTQMWKVKSRLEELYLDADEMDDEKMTYGAIQGMVAALGDPYTVFLPPSDNKAANEDLAGEFGGVGIQLGYKDKTLSVMAPLAKTPAEAAGIKAGDLILKIIDKEKEVDKDTAGISLDEAVSLIRGPVGSKVTLKLYREGKSEAFDVELKRDNIVVASLEMEWVEREGKKFAWVKLYKFTDRLFTEWPEMVEKIRSEKDDSYGGLVLDVRNNPGGFLQASVLVASDFLKEGLVVKQESSNGKTEVYEVDKKRGYLLDDKMVVLVNGGSASASEILAGALKDYNRAKLVGEKTFGKGTVQQPENFADGSGIHVTIARWLLPKGNNIHNEGVNPDVEVIYEANEEDPKKDNQLEKAIEVLLEK